MRNMLARDEVSQTFQRDSQACKAEYAQAKKQIEEQFKKDQRRAKKAKEETGWQALAFFEGSREEGVKWRRATDANWHGALDEFHLKKETAEYILKRFGRLAANLPDPVIAPPVETPAPVPAVADAAAPAAEGAAPTDEEPKDTTPLGSLNAISAHIDKELIATEALKLPKFLRPDMFIWPFLFLAVGVVGALGVLTPVGWTVAGVVGGVVGVGAGIGAYIALSKTARPQVVEHAVLLRNAIFEGDQLIEQNKEWVKIEFEGKLKELDKNRETKVRDAEEVMNRRIGELQERQQKQLEEADKIYPRGSATLAAARTRGTRRSRPIFRRRSRPSRKNTRPTGASLMNRMHGPRRPRRSNTSRPGTS